jgi:Nif-specific regulatory protein
MGRIEKETLLRATTLLYLFREWVKGHSQASRSLIETQIMHVVGDLLGYAEGLQGRMQLESERRPGRAPEEECEVPLYAGGQLEATLCLRLGAPGGDLPEDVLDTLGAVANLASVALESAKEAENLRAEVALLEERLFPGGLTGESQPIQKLRQMIKRVAVSETTVLILGESGTGKELVARSIHEQSRRKDNPFVPINCAAITDTLLESELFGYEKGAFTGADAQKKGRLEMAQDGTVFLDEVGELAPGLQAKLLRVLQEKEMVRVGGVKPVKLDVRIVAATNRDLAAETRAGKFREDLYHRLNVIALRTPALRERKDDIPLLAMQFLDKSSRQCGRRMKGISPAAEACLRNYDWPGNVRELENAIERAVVLAETDFVLPEDLPEAVGESASHLAGSTYQVTVGSAKRSSILKAYENAGGDYKAAAKLLGIHPNYLLRLVRNLGLRDEIAHRRSGT